MDGEMNGEIDGEMNRETTVECSSNHRTWAPYAIKTIMSNNNNNTVNGNDHHNNNNSTSDDHNDYNDYIRNDMPAAEAALASRTATGRF